MAQLKVNPTTGKLDMVRGSDEFTLDHGGLTGLSDDDHSQYWIAGTARTGDFETSGDITITTGWVVAYTGGFIAQENVGSGSGIQIDDEKMILFNAADLNQSWRMERDGDNLEIQSGTSNPSGIVDFGANGLLTTGNLTAGTKIHSNPAGKSYILADSTTSYNKAMCMIVGDPSTRLLVDSGNSFYITKQTTANIRSGTITGGTNLAEFTAAGDVKATQDVYGRDILASRLVQATANIIAGTQISAGTQYVVGTMTISSASITDSSGDISFGNENLTTTGSGTFNSLVSPSLTGNTGSGDDLTLQSTSHATKGKVLFGTSAYDEVNNRLGIRTTAPTYAIDIAGGANDRFRASSSSYAVSFEMNAGGVSWSYMVFKRLNAAPWSAGLDALDSNSFKIHFGDGFTSGYAMRIDSSTKNTIFSGTVTSTGTTTGATTMGDGGTTNYLNVSATGDVTFAGSAGFYPREIAQDSEPAAGTGSTQIDSGEFAVWRDTNDSDKIYFMYNYNGTVVKTLLS